MTEPTQRLFGITISVELAALLVAGMAPSAMAPQGGAQWLANCAFALLLFAYAMGTRLGRDTPMRQFLAASLLLLPLLLCVTIALLMASGIAGAFFLDVYLRVGFVSGGARDAWLPMLLAIWWITMMPILIATIGVRNLILGFLID